MDDGLVDHIGIATSSLDDSEQFWSALGFTPDSDEINDEQGVRIRFMDGKGSTRIELLEPLGEETPVGRFLSRRGPGVQQIAIKVQNIEDKIDELLSMGVKMVSDEPSTGIGGNRIAFIHPSSAGGVLVELVESPK